MLCCLPGQSFAGDCVVLLHGLGRSEMSMKAIEWRLNRSPLGYTVVNQGYPSLSQPIETLAVTAIDDARRKCHEAGTRQIHFVTHSLGGILLRQYLSGHEIANIGRTVMLGPPNQGSALAEYLASISIVEKLRPTAARQLGTGEASIPAQLGPVNFEVGIIAGNRSLRPWISRALQGASDGTVSVEETRVAGMTDFVELPATHSLMMWQSAVLNQVEYFLLRGHFRRN